MFQKFLIYSIIIFLVFVNLILKLNINNIDINQNYLLLTNHEILYKGA